MMIRIMMLGLFSVVLSGCYWTPGGYQEKPKDPSEKPQTDPSSYHKLSSPTSIAPN